MAGTDRSKQMKVTFIFPCVGRRRGQPYPRSWLMEPLAIAQLSALTPPSWEKAFFDDRLDKVLYDEPTDLVALSVETYTARRAYQIADRFRAKGVKVVMGGFHPSLAPEDAMKHADSVVVGEAEETWPLLLEDFTEGALQRRYEAAKRPELTGVVPDRTIFAGKKYLDMALVETARGCRHACDFCSISAFYRRSYLVRPVDEVVREVRALNRHNIFFVDDNLAVDRTRTLRLLRALEPLHISWAGQMGVQMAEDEELLDAMRLSGCMGVLIGFESLSSGSKALSGKGIQDSPEALYDRALAKMAKHRIAVYGTFVFGYDEDTFESIKDAATFADRHRLFFAAFNHLVPFPGTPLFRRLLSEHRLKDEAWWLSKDYRFGDLAFNPSSMSADDLSKACFQSRQAFYSLTGILRRACNFRANCRNLFMTGVFLAANLMSRKEVVKRQGLPLGAEE